MKEKKKYPKKVLVIALVLFVVFAGITFVVMKGLDKVDIQESFAQDQISQRLPIVSEFNILLVKCDLVIDSLAVQFLDDDRISVVAHGTIETSKGNAELTIESIGVPAYANQGFYFKPDYIDYKDFQFSEEAKGNIGTVGTIAKNFSNKYLKDLVKDTNIKLDTEKFVEKLKATAKASVQKRIISYLYKNPVKKLDGFKGTVVSLAIDKIKVNDRVLTIHFSFLKLTGRIILLVFVFFGAIAFVLTAPWWATGSMYILGGLGS